MNVLVIGYVWPEPNSSAAGSRMMQLLHTFLQQGWHINFASQAQPTVHQQDLQSLGIDCHNIQVNCSSFDSLINEIQPDIVMYDRFMMEEQFGWRVRQTCPDVLNILNTEDLHFLRNAREQALKQNKKLDTELLHSDMALREVSAILRSDLTLMISRAESELLREHFHIADYLLHEIPLFYAEQDKVTSPLPFTERQHFITVGNFRHQPNWDAVLWLRQQIWPAIRKQLPDAQMHIYGAYPPKKATQLHNESQGFLVLGWAQDAKAVVSQARVCLAPLRFGAGIKGKLLEAMLCGTPSVTTDIGSEGIAQSNQWPGYIANTAEDLIASAVALYKDPQTWQQAQTRGFELIQHKFLAEPHQHQLIKAIEKASQNLQSNRLSNFTGLMLKHHQHRSTEFMSRWIEAKNRLQQHSDGSA